jgi:Cu-Zn family superoxide dismutase
MKTRTKVKLAVVLAAVAASGTWGVMAALSDPNVIRASAVIAGPPGSGISGEVHFAQAGTDDDAPVPGVWVVAKASGLPPGPHGFHIHERGACEPTFAAAGAHYDPSSPGDTANAQHPWHMGELPNLVANPAGNASLNHMTSRITLSAGALTVFDADGSAVIIHQDRDQGVPGLAGGARIACGVIQMD